METKELLPIESFWILDKDSGILLFRKDFEDELELNISVDLVSGFLSAVSTFVDDAFSDGIQRILFHKKAIQFNFTENLLFLTIFSSKKTIDEKMLTQFISKAIDKFYDRYGERIMDGKINSEYSHYQTFERDLAKIFFSFPKDAATVPSKLIMQCS